MDFTFYSDTPARASVKEQPAGLGRPAHVLVLDDEELLAEMLGQIIEQLGHACTLSRSPVQALEQVRKHDFDLILSDYWMPVMDGRQFYQRVAQLKPSLASRIVFVTGDVMNEETQTFLASVGNARLIKPFQLQAVESTVKRVLQEQVAAAHEDVSCMD